MMGRCAKWLALAGSAGSMVALLTATGRLIPGGPPRDRPLAIHGAGTPNLGRAWLDAAGEALDRDHHDEAERLARQVLAIRERALGPGHPALASALCRLSGSFYGRDRFAEAEPPLRRALEILGRHPGSSPSGQIRVLGLLSLVSARRGDRAGAEALSLRSIALAEASPGFREADLIDALTLRTALLGEVDGRYVEAAAVADRALAALERQPDPDPDDLAAKLYNAGVVRLKLGQYPEADRLLSRSKAIRAARPEVPAAERYPYLENLAHLYREQGRFAEAEPVDRQLLAIAEEVRGPDHPGLAERCVVLAGVLERLDRGDEIEPLARRAIAIAEQGYAAEDTGLADILARAAMLLRGRGYSDEALTLLGRALAIVEGRSDGLAQAQVLEELAKTRVGRAEPAEAEAAVKRAIAVRETAQAGPADRLAGDLLYLAVIQANRKAFAEAEPSARRAVAIAEEAHGPDDPGLLPALNYLAGILQEIGHDAEALAVASRAMAIVEKGPEGATEARTSVLALLAHLQARQGHPEESEATERRRRDLIVADAARRGMVEVEGGWFVPSADAPLPVAF